MVDYTPFASLLLADELASDPFGTVHRGIELYGPHRGRNILVRRYHEHWIAAGLLKNLPEIQRNVLHLGKLKLFQDVRLERDEAPHFVWPLCQGRSLARVLQEAEAQQVPFGLDQALFMAWILCQHIVQLRQAGIALGFLTPHRIWLGFDGVVELLDAPVIQQMEQVLEGHPELRGPLAPYLLGPKHEGIQHDAYQVGALLFEVLTHRPLPEARYLAKELGLIQIQGPDGRESIPPSIVVLMTRLLGLGRPFQSLEELTRGLEEVLFGTEDFNPSSFGLAFTLHTLFRLEREAENQALEDEQGETGIIACQIAVKEAAPSARPLRKSRLGARLLLSAATVLGGLTTLAALRIHGSPAPITGSSSGSSNPATPPSPVAAATVPPALAPLSKPTEPSAKPIITPSSTPSATPPATPRPTTTPRPTASTTALVQAGTPAGPRLLQRPSLPGGSPVRLRVYVDEQGRVRQAFVIDGAPKGSDRERQACAAAMGARFSPSIDNGKAIRDWTELSLSAK